MSITRRVGPSPYRSTMAQGMWCKDAPIFDVSSLRTTTSVRGKIPWTVRTVVLIRVDAKGVVWRANSITDKRKLITLATSRDLVLVAWPGTYTQEIFYVDNLAMVRREIARSNG
jgi:hypothetical protein